MKKKPLVDNVTAGSPVPSGSSKPPGPPRPLGSPGPPEPSRIPWLPASSRPSKSFWKNYNKHAIEWLVCKYWQNLRFLSSKKQFNLVMHNILILFFRFFQIGFHQTILLFWYLWIYRFMTTDNWKKYHTIKKEIEYESKRTWG